MLIEYNTQSKGKKPLKLQSPMSYAIKSLGCKVDNRRPSNKYTLGSAGYLHIDGNVKLGGNITNGIWWSFNILCTLSLWLKCHISFWKTRSVFFFITQRPLSKQTKANQFALRRFFLNALRRFALWSCTIRKVLCAYEIRYNTDNWFLRLTVSLRYQCNQCQTEISKSTRWA